jgi:uncharacterized protein YidB (DUF937 family)
MSSPSHFEALQTRVGTVIEGAEHVQGDVTRIEEQKYCETSAAQLGQIGSALASICEIATGLHQNTISHHQVAVAIPAISNFDEHGGIKEIQYGLENAELMGSDKDGAREMNEGFQRLRTTQGAYLHSVTAERNAIGSLLNILKEAGEQFKNAQARQSAHAAFNKDLREGAQTVLDGAQTYLHNAQQE